MSSPPSLNSTDSNSESTGENSSSDEDSAATGPVVKQAPDATPSTLEEAVGMIHGLRQRVSELECQVRKPGIKPSVIRGNNEHDSVLMLKSAIDQCSEAIFFTDINGVILYVNRSFEQSSGYSRDELLGKTPRILKSGKHPKSYYKQIWDTLLSGNIFRGRVINKRKDNSLYVEDSNNAPLRNTEGGIIGFVSVRVDVTDLLETQRQMQAVNQELKRSNNELQQFAHVASHDLQEPLRSISSCMQLLQKHYAASLDERASEYISHAVSGCSRMRDRIEALLSMSRVDAAFGDLEDVDSGEALGEALINLAALVKESGAQISYDRLPVVKSCRIMLPQLFQNLLSNAIKFRGDHLPIVHVGAKRDGHQWQFSVSDNGIGVDPDHYQRIFELFQRLHSYEEYAGTGLGLAICKKIVEHHGGKLWVESVPGHGSTFHFTLPCLPNEEPEPDKSHE